MNTTQQKTGKIKFFSQSRGFGFIVNDETGVEIFVHISNVNRTSFLKEGDAVIYEEGESKKGPIAINVSKD